MTLKQKFEMLYHMFGVAVMFGNTLMWALCLKALYLRGPVTISEPNHLILSLELFILSPFMVTYALLLNFNFARKYLPRIGKIILKKRE